jgi:hypothetical protein
MADDKPIKIRFRDVAEPILGRETVDAWHEIVQIARAAVPVLVELTAIAAACAVAFQEADKQAADLAAAWQCGTPDDVHEALARMSGNVLAHGLFNRRQRERAAGEMRRREARNRSDIASTGGLGKGISFAAKRAKVQKAFRKWKDKEPDKYKSQNQFNDAMARKHRIGKTTVRDWCLAEIEKNLSDSEHP